MIFQGCKQKDKLTSIKGGKNLVDRRRESVKTTIEEVRTERRRHEKSKMPTKAATRPTTDNGTTFNVNEDTENTFRMYKVVLRKTSPDTWNSPARKDEYADKHGIEIICNEPQNPETVSSKQRCSITSN